MSQAPPDLLGRLAVHYRMISMPQLSTAVQEQGRSPQKKLGAILVELGFINATQLAQLLEAQRQYLARQGGGAPASAPAAEVKTRPNATLLGHRSPVNARAQARPAGAAAPPPAPPQPHAPPPPQPTAPSPAARERALARHQQSSQAISSAQVPVMPTTLAVRPGREIALSPARVEWLHRVLQHSRQLDASDVHLHAGSPIKTRIHGVLADLSPDVLPLKEAESVLIPVMTREQREAFYEEGQIDFTYAAPGIGRFRVNIYQQSTGPCGVFHYIPAEPPFLSDLGLPNIAARLINHANGIVLITGPAGSGKTSTMAALINLINEERTDHVLSIEDPIEYLHTSKRCIVNQRQVSRDTRSFANALRSALREDPDVICIGELRDLETISLAMSAAETGHLVIGTLHTQGAIRTINRIIGAYPPSQQTQVRTMLAESLRAIISQKLVLRASGDGMVLAYELLMVNTAASNLIRENRTFQLGTVLQMGRSKGMRSMDDSLLELVKRGEISRKDALLHCDDPRMFQG